VQCSQHMQKERAAELLREVDRLSRPQVNGAAVQHAVSAALGLTLSAVVISHKPDRFTVGSGRTSARARSAICQPFPPTTRERALP